MFKGSQADVMLDQFYKSVPYNTEGYWTYTRRIPPTYFYVFDKPVAATDADMNTHFNFVRNITSTTDKILPPQSCMERILDLDMTIVYMKSHVGEFKALDEIPIPEQMLNDVLCFQLQKYIENSLDYKDFCVFTNTSKVFPDTRAISMFSSSKPDLMMFRKDNPEIGVFCQCNVEEDVNEDMETEESEEEYITDPLAQLLGNMEKVAGEMVKVFIINDATGKRIEILKIYGIIINCKMNICEHYLLTLKLTEPGYTLLEKGSKNLEIHTALQRILACLK